MRNSNRTLTLLAAISMAMIFVTSTVSAHYDEKDIGGVCPSDTSFSHSGGFIVATLWPRWGYENRCLQYRIIMRVKNFNGSGNGWETKYFYDRSRVTSIYADDVLWVKYEVKFIADNGRIVWGGLTEWH